MRKYLPVVFLLTTVFGVLSFNLAIEVIASIEKKTDIESLEQKSQIQWWKKFQDVDTEGKKLSSATIKTPYVLVNFWASWCTPCLKEFPELVELRKKISEEKLLILGINCDQEEEKKTYDQIKKKFNINFRNVLDPKNNHLTAIGSQTLPVTLLFYKGELIYSSHKQTQFLNKKFLNLLNQP